MTSDRSEPTRLYTFTFFLGFVYNFLMGFLFSSNSLYPLYVEYARGGAFEVGLFMAAFPLAGMLGRPLHGALIDRFGVKEIMIVGASLYALPCLGYIALMDEGLTPAVWALRLLQGFGFGAHVSAFFTLAALMAPDGRRNEAVAMYGVSGMLAGLIGPLACELSIERLGMASFFWIMLTLGLLAAVIAAIIKAPRRPEGMESFSFDGVKTILRLRRFRMGFYFAFSLAVSFTTMTAFIAPVMKHREVPYFGLFFTFYAITGVFVRIMSRKWADQYGFMRVLAPGFFCYGLGLLMLQFTHSVPMLIVAGFFCGGAHGLVFPIATTLGFVLAPVAYRGTGVALVTGMMDLGNSFAAFALGSAAAWYGYDVVYLLGAVAPFAATAVILWKGKEFDIEALELTESS